MERLLDKVVVLACCLAMVVVTPFSMALLVGLLASLIVSGLFEIGFIPKRVRTTLLGAFLVFAIIVPEAMLFVPLIAYDCMRTSSWVLRIGPVAPLLVGFALLPFQISLFSLVVAGVAYGLSWRTGQVEVERTRFRALRDDLRETSLALEGKNQDLQDKQDYEVSLATLNERGRIAREIHDNVGHLLTRSVLQVEALQVIHADDPAVKEELSGVGATLHEALDTVRVSVHDLHDTSFDLRTQLYSTAENEQLLAVEIDYNVVEIPQTVGYCFVAIVREAIANTSKHSDADRVGVSVIEHPGFYQLAVRDNGSRSPKQSHVERGVSGSGVAAGSAIRGIGLQTMEDRARALGGVFRTDYDRGFRIFVSVPKGSE